MPSCRLRARQRLVHEETSRAQCSKERWKQETVQVMHHDDDVVSVWRELETARFEIHDLGLQRQVKTRGVGVERGNEIGVSIHSSRSKSAFGQPQRMAAASA